MPRVYIALKSWKDKAIDILCRFDATVKLIVLQCKYVTGTRDIMKYFLTTDDICKCLTPDV